MWGAEPNRWVVEETAGLAPGRALDLAAGEGRNSIWLASQGWRVTAVDFSATGLERGRQLAAGRPEVAERLTWVCADLLRHQPAPGMFDLVVIAYLHLPADQRRLVCRRAADALAPGGTLLVVGHDSANLADGIGGPQDPSVLFTAQDVRDDVADAGLETVSVRAARRPATGADGRRGEAIDAVARLRRPVDGPSGG